MVLLLLVRRVACVVKIGNQLPGNVFSSGIGNYRWGVEVPLVLGSR